MFTFLVRFAKLFFVGSMAVFAAGFVLLGALFLYQLWNTYGPKIVLDAPGGGWTVTLQEVSFTAHYMKTARVDVHRGPMAGHALLCRFDQATSGRPQLNDIVSTTWSDDGLT